MSKTLAAMTQNNWAYGGAAGFARYEFSDDFVDEDGRQFEAGPKSYLEVATTIVGSVVTVPAYPNFPTTENAVINNGVTVTCHLLDSNRVKRTTLFEDCRIYASLPATITLAQLVLANGASRKLRDTDVWTKEQVIDYVETRVGGAGGTLGAGRATLVNGAATVPETSVAADSVIQLTPLQANIGVPRVGAIVVGVSFEIISTDGADSGEVGWTIFAPS